MDPTIVIALLTLGVILLLLGLVGKVEAQILKIGTENKFARVISGLLGLAFICVSLYYVLNPTPKPSPQKSTDSVSIVDKTEESQNPSREVTEITPESTASTTPLPTLTPLPDGTDTPTPTSTFFTSTPTSTPTPTPTSTNTLGHACRVQPVSYTFQPSPYFLPPKIKGDNDFGGNGPRINVKVTVYMTPDHKVWMNIYMAAQEFIIKTGLLGDSRAQGDTKNNYKFNDFLGLEIPVQPGWELRLAGGLSSLTGEITFIDLDHTRDIFPGDNSQLEIDNFGPVKTFDVIGDITGDDIGLVAGKNTGVRVTLNPTGVLEQVEVQGCIH